MLYAALADTVFAIHLLFMVFAVLGGLLVYWRRWFMLLHLPALGWAALVVLLGWPCPLTSLEKWFLEEGYTGGFIEHYILPVLYPPGLTREQQVVLGVCLVGFNLLVYAVAFDRWWHTATSYKPQATSKNRR